MNIALIAAYSVSFIALLTAHSAGASYVVSARDNQSSLMAFVKTVISLLLIVLVIRILTHQD
jgi:hypothetical protein